MNDNNNIKSQRMRPQIGGYSQRRYKRREESWRNKTKNKLLQAFEIKVQGVISTINQFRMRVNNSPNGAINDGFDEAISGQLAEAFLGPFEGDIKDGKIYYYDQIKERIIKYEMDKFRNKFESNQRNIEERKEREGNMNKNGGDITLKKKIDLFVMNKKKDKLLAEKDDKIKELESRLKKLEQRYGASQGILFGYVRRENQRLKDENDRVVLPKRLKIEYENDNKDQSEDIKMSEITYFCEIKMVPTLRKVSNNYDAMATMNGIIGGCYDIFKKNENYTLCSRHKNKDNSHLECVGKNGKKFDYKNEKCYFGLIEKMRNVQFLRNKMVHWEKRNNKWERKDVKELLMFIYYKLNELEINYVKGGN